MLFTKLILELNICNLAVNNSVLVITLLLAHSNQRGGGEKGKATTAALRVW